uniref:RNase H type-1 domain-containing protein n=1 Tax=Cacopsylla melanoneura TaxID=428564 RepID=A0A8D9A9T4_9HEMI
MNIVKVLSKQTWGADRKTLTSLYKSLIRSKMEYGSMIYNSASENNLKILNPIHNQCMRYATGAFCTTPINALNIETNEPPPEVRRKIQMTSYAAKVLSIQNHPCYNLLMFPKFLSLLENKKINTTNVLLQEYYPLFKKITHIKHRTLTPWEENKTEINFQLHIYSKNNTNAQVIKTIFLSVVSEYNNCVKIYTDGSKDSTYSGCAFVIPEQNITRKYRLDPKSSVFTCELYAIYSALKLIYDTNNTYPQSYVIISDSQAALQAISRVGNAINPMVTNIQDLLHNIQHNQIQINFLWCPSHCGIQGNEDADQAAKSSLTEPEVPVYECITPTDLAASIKQTILKRWRDSFEFISTKISEIKQYPATWTTSTQNSRSNETTLMRLRTGHSRLTHQYLLKREDPPTCQCGEILSIKHILTACSTHTVQRNIIFPPSEQTLCDMLKDSSDSVHRVFTFINKATIKDL